MKSQVYLPEGRKLLDDKEAMRKAFGRIIWRLMRDKGWNQSELGRQAGISRDAVSTYCTGKNFPEPATMQKLANALGVDVDTLYPTSVDVTAPRPSPVEVALSASDPGRAMLRINREVSLTTLAKVIDLLKEDGGD